MSISINNKSSYLNLKGINEIIKKGKEEIKRIRKYLSLWIALILLFVIPYIIKAKFGGLASLFTFTLLFINFALGAVINYYINLIEEINTTKQDLKESNQQLTRKLDKAKRIHKSFLPEKDLNTEDYSLDYYYKEAENISGDYYNYIELDDKIIGYISDVTGHGLDGALVNIFIRETINNFLNQDLVITPNNILKFIIKRYAEESFPADYSLCITFWVLDKKSGELYYNNAGNHIPILLMKGTEVSSHIETNPPVSNVFSPKHYNFDTNILRLQAKDKVLFLTDGLIEQQCTAKRYGLDKLIKLVKKGYYLNLDSLLKTIYQDFNSCLNASSQSDDVTLFGIQRNV